jgi:organic radical activating enzyme
MKYKINEIFASIQGEGHFTGYPATFIRFSGCNLSCPFCDTRHKSGKLYSLNQIILKCKRLNQRRVILTGGEPLLQADYKFVAALKRRGFIVHCESNGTIMAPSNIDWLTISPKPGALWRQTFANEIKVVYTGQDLSPYESKGAALYFYLQPCSGKNVKQTILKVKGSRKWLLSSQLQKYLRVR